MMNESGVMSSPKAHLSQKFINNEIEKKPYLNKSTSKYHSWKIKNNESVILVPLVNIKPITTQSAHSTIKDNRSVGYDHSV
jgi:hypothetical protein